MKIAVIGSGLRRTGGRAPAWRRTATMSSVSTRTRPRSGCCSAGRSPFTSPGSKKWSAGTRAKSASPSRPRSPVASAGADHLHRRRHAHGRGRFRRSAACPRRRARDCPRDERLQGRRQQEHGPGRHGGQGSGRHPAGNDAPLQRGEQSRVPEAGRRHRRLHEAGPRRHRGRGSALGRADEGTLCALHANGRADHDDGLPERRAQQVCRECHAGDAHLVHERSRERVRGGRRERRSGAPRRGFGPAHRPVVPLPGRRLRRQLFSEGRQGDGALRRGQGLRLPDPARRRGGQRGAEASARDEDGSALRFAQGQAHRALGAGLQAEDRRHARGSGRTAHQGPAGRRARRYMPTIRKR